jgi:hypothetical protein
MKIAIHPHAAQRMRERGATAAQVRQTVSSGHPTPAKFGRIRFHHVFPFDRMWNGKRYARRQIDALAVKMRDGWLVVTIIVKYF